MSKKERPKIYQHTSGGGHELIHNNPSPLEAIDKIEIRIGSMSLQLGKEFKIIEQALTNYANMVEMLEGLKEDVDFLKLHDNYDRYIFMELIENFITKVLEGKNDERDMEKG
jgi:hypothetical protein